MSNITRRLDELEQEHEEELKPIVWEDRWGDKPAPQNLEGRPLIKVRWAHCPEEGTPDPSRI